MAEMSAADQVRGAVNGLLAAGVETRETVELIENIPSWRAAWDYHVDMDGNIYILDLSGEE